MNGAFDLQLTTFRLNKTNSGAGVFKTLRTITRLLAVSCEHNDEHMAYIKSGELFCLAEQLLVSEELLCLIELVRITIAED